MGNKVQMEFEEVIRLAVFGLRQGNASAVPAFLREAFERFMVKDPPELLGLLQSILDRLEDKA